jgi:hypothetical protein
VTQHETFSMKGLMMAKDSTKTTDNDGAHNTLGSKSSSTDSNIETTKSVAEREELQQSADELAAEEKEALGPLEEEITDDDILDASGPLALLLINKGIISRKDVLEAMK